MQYTSLTATEKCLFCTETHASFLKSSFIEVMRTSCGRKITCRPAMKHGVLHISRCIKYTMPPSIVLLLTALANTDGHGKTCVY